MVILGYWEAYCSLVLHWPCVTFDFITITLGNSYSTAYRTA